MQISHYATNDQIRSQLVQIFRYIQALNQLRNPPQKEIQAQPWVMWFHDLPSHPSIRRGVIVESSRVDSEEEAIGDDFILKVSRPNLTEAPEPPVEIFPWLQDGWQNIDGQVIIKPTINQTRNAQSQSLHFQDDPQRKRLLETWVAKREQWIAAETPARRTMDMYEKLYALLPVIERESERIELMVGDGIVNWSTLVHHPVLLISVQLHFNPEIPEFTIVETGQISELYTAIFQAVPNISANEIARCREDHEKGEWHPLGGEETTRFLKRLASQLSPYGELTQEGILQQNRHVPSIARDPVLFLRPRNLGMNTALNAILEVLPDNSELSAALTSLVKVSTDTDQTGKTNAFDNIPIMRTFDVPNGEDEYILLSKSANAEQLEIARRLERDAAVLVQGPPGTGKTHTIANLIGHLLAQGKSVLVTSEKPKALRVLKEKVVEPLQPLCVSILEDDSRKEMERTIDAISERLAYADADKLEREAAILIQHRINLLRQLRETRHKLIEARGSEYRVINIAGESYSPAEAARHITQKRELSGWIPGPVIPEAPLPLSISELLDLYNSNEAITPKDEREISLFLPESGKLLSPIDFERAVYEQTQLRQSNLGYRHDLWIRSNQNYSNEEIQQIQQRLVQEIEPLRNLTGWRLAAIVAGREGGAYRRVWDDLVQEVERAYNFAIQAQIWLFKYGPNVPQECLPDRIERVLNEIIDYLKHGGKLGSFKLLVNRDWKLLIENASVQGKPPEVLDHFEALRYFVILRTARQNLVGRWQRQMSVLGDPDVTTIGPSPEVTFYQ